MRALALLPLFTLFACSDQGVILQDDGSFAGLDDTGEAATEDDTGDVEEPDYSEFDGATLVIKSPESGAFLELGDDADFEAELVAADGSDLDFDEVVWTSSLDEDWSVTGLNEESDELSAGTHTITATAVLPNGDRLVSAVGGVLVQHEDAGLYVGNLYVDTTVEYDGSDITTTCIGATVLIVDQEGKTATGESSCTLALFGYSIDAAHIFSFENDDGDLEGTTEIDFTIGSFDFDATGEVGGDELTATWTGDVYGQADIEGSLELERVSRETSY